MYDYEITEELCRAIISVLGPFSGRLAAYDREKQAHCCVVRVKMHPTRTSSGDYAADGTGRLEVVLQSPDYFNDGNFNTWSYWLDNQKLAATRAQAGLPIRVQTEEAELLLAFREKQKECAASC
jgi:hypothetical protein